MAKDARQGGGHVWPAVGAVAALVGGAGALLGGLAAAGVFDDADASPPAVQTVTPTSRVVSLTPTTNAATPTQSAARASRASATLVYLQGATGCSPTFTLSIGDRAFTPMGTTYPLPDLATGTQQYLIDGAVACLDGTGCVATGSGTVDVLEGRTFEVVWEEIGFQQCDMRLLW